MSMPFRTSRRTAGGAILALAVAGALLPGLLLSGGSVVAAEAITLADDHADAADLEWDAASEVGVSLADGASSGGDGVTVDGDVVTISAAGTYRLTGTLSDGQVVVNAAADDLVRLVLDGVSIESSTTAPLSALSADKVVIVLAEGSSNVLTDAETYVDASADVDEPNAALFADVDLTVGGTGALSVTGRSNDGIASKDGLVISGGDITVTAVDDGIRGKDYLVIADGTLSVDARGDALKADEEEDAELGWIRIDGGSLTLSSGADAIEGYRAVIVNDGSLAIAAEDDAIHSEQRLEVHGGTVDISRSVEGLEGTQIVIDGGELSVVSSDDAVNVAGETEASTATLETVDARGGRGPGGGGFGGEQAVAGWYLDVAGGTLVIDAGGDGIDSNGTASISGGTIVIDGPTADMNGALDAAGGLTISGGTLVASGSAGMAESPESGSAQASLSMRFESDVPAGTVVTIQAADGTPIVAYASSKPWAALVVSTPDLVAGDAYEVLLGGSASGEQVGGLYLDPEASGGTSVGTLTAA